VCGCSFTKVPLGSVALFTRTMSPSCNNMFCIICKTTLTPVSIEMSPSRSSCQNTLVPLCLFLSFISHLLQTTDKQQEMVIVLPKLIKPLLPFITFHSSDSSRKRTAGDTHEVEWKTLCARKTHPVWHVDHAFFSNKLQDATVTGAGG
jgi:hypothetical protein